VVPFAREKGRVNRNQEHGVGKKIKGGTKRASEFVRQISLGGNNDSICTASPDNTHLSQ
jgi:hypothetical protein